MQPRNAFQRKVVALSTGVKPVSSTQFSWANINCFDKKGTFTSKRANCFECGDTWRIDGSGMSQKTCKCPSCGVRLKMERSRSMKHGSAAYFAIVTTVSDVQLIRMFLITKKCMVGHVAAFEYSEVMQHWIGENGARAVFSKLVNGFNYACDAWLHASALELRGTLGYSQTMRNGIVPYKIYPKMQVIPAIRRNGFEGKFHGVAPLILFTSILMDSKAETLLKTGQVHLLRVYPDHRNWIDNLWGSIKICIRRKYIIPDALIWKDYLQLLDNYSCDLRNARFVCPENLQEAHDQLVQKKLADDKKKLALAGQDAERVYRKARSMFFGLCFSDGDITINVIGSVAEVETEGSVLKHCVFTNRYHHKDDSLLLSARIDGTHLETVEISLSKLKIVQARGKENQPSVYHDRIIGLVNQNMAKVRTIYRESLKQG